MLFSLDFGNQASDDIVVFVRFLLGEVISIVMMVLLHKNKSTFHSIRIPDHQVAKQKQLVFHFRKSRESGGLE